jgi:hypothetical protein
MFRSSSSLLSNKVPKQKRLSAPYKPLTFRKVSISIVAGKASDGRNADYNTFLTFSPLPT